MKLLLCGLDNVAYLDGDGTYYRYSAATRLPRLQALADHIVYVTTVQPAPEDKAGLVSIRYPNVDIVRCPKCNTFKELFTSRRSIKRILKKYIPLSDRVYTPWQGYYVPLVARLSAKYGKRYLLELGGEPWAALWNHGWKGKLLAVPTWMGARRAFGKAPYALYVTQRYLQGKCPCPRGKTAGITNAEIALPGADALAARLDRIHSQKKRIIIGTTAAVNVRYKGQQYVIRALAELQRRGYAGYEYQLVGGGDPGYLRSVAEECGVSDRVKFMGLMGHDQVFSWLDGIDIYIHPSITEGLPRVVLEAMSRGVPCIGARTAAIPELLDAEYIYDDRKKPSVIADMILKMDTPAMAEQAQRNFTEAQKYGKEILDRQRGEFYADFMSE